MKQIAAVSKAPSPHWVGDGFPVRSLFSYDSHGTELSPFLLLDYAGPQAFPAIHDYLMENGSPLAPVFRRAGATAKGFAADVTQPGDMQMMAEAAASAHGAAQRSNPRPCRDSSRQTPRSQACRSPPAPTG